jgi:hypothetical protein
MTSIAGIIPTFLRENTYFDKEHINASYTDGQQSQDRTKKTAQHGDLQGAALFQGRTYSWHFK